MSGWSSSDDLRYVDYSKDTEFQTIVLECIVDLFYQNSELACDCAEAFLLTFPKEYRLGKVLYVFRELECVQDLVEQYYSTDR